MVKRKEVMASNPKGKLVENWVGPYIVRRVYEGGAYVLVDHKGAIQFSPLNGKHIKLYHAAQPTCPE